jgi:transcriptional regulator with XRE-family HTH domain
MLLCVQGSLSAIARELGIKSVNSVSEWRRGAKTPSIEARYRMQEAFGIPAAAWQVAPGSTVALTTPDQPKPTVRGTTLDDCLKLWDQLESARAQSGLAASERVRLSDAASKVLALRARLEGAAELSEDRYVFEHPAWRRLKRLLLDALEPYPAAGLAVRKAIASAPRASLTASDNDED